MLTTLWALAPGDPPPCAGGSFLEAGSDHALDSRADLIEERIGHLEHAALQSLGADQTELREDVTKW